jgi:hypothetical protein
MRIFLVLLLMSGLSVAQPNAAFDEEHAKGLKENPPGLELTFSTVDGKSVYHWSDKVRFRLVVTATKANVYTLETASGVNMAGISEDLVIATPELAVPIHSLKRSHLGAVCCWSKRRYVDRKPSAIEFGFRFSLFHLSDFERALQPGSIDVVDVNPGEVYVFLQTSRILRGWPKSDNQKYFERGIVVTSQNVLHLTILPDESKGSSR